MQIPVFLTNSEGFVMLARLQVNYVCADQERPWAY